MALVRSPLRYPGGKSKAVKFLAKFFPDFKELREPMCGGASITLYWAQVKPSRSYIISDINYDLYCFWKELKINHEKLIKELILIRKSFSDGRKLYHQIIERRDKERDDLTRALDFFILNRITFSGTTESGGYSEEAFQKRFTLNSIYRLGEVSRILQRIEIYHGDYSEIFSNCKEDVLIFLDPPYYSSKRSRLYGRRGDFHVNFDHEKLAQDVKKVLCKVLITYDNHPHIKSLYKGFYMLEWRLKYGMTNHCRDHLRDGDELLIANFELREPCLLLL
ncbi:DNA adenine methylase [Thermocrinis sp.]